MCETYAISRSVTFFALPDWAFPKPPHHHGGEEDARLEELFETSGDLTEMLAAAEGYLNRAHEPDQDKIKKFIKLSLLYSILPEETPLHKLRSNHTFATSLKLQDGSLDGEPLRIHVGKSFGFDFRPSVNFVSKVLVPDIPTSNGKHPSGEVTAAVRNLTHSLGAIHVVSRPVLPPPSILQTTFLVSDVFSTFVSLKFIATSAFTCIMLTSRTDLCCSAGWAYVRSGFPRWRGWFH